MKTSLRTGAVALCLSLAALGTTAGCSDHDDCDSAGAPSAVVAAAPGFIDGKGGRGGKSHSGHTKHKKHKKHGHGDDDCD